MHGNCRQLRYSLVFDVVWPRGALAKASGQRLDVGRKSQKFGEASVGLERVHVCERVMYHGRCCGGVRAQGSSMVVEHLHCRPTQGQPPKIEPRGAPSRG